MATLSILGLYNYDNTIFDGFTLPEDLDKDTVVGNLLMELAELEVIYPSAPMMRQAIFLWSAKMLHKWAKLYDTTKLVYDPINNYELTVTWTETDSREGDRQTSGTSSGTSSGTGQTTGTTSATTSREGHDSNTHTDGSESSATSETTGSKSSNGSTSKSVSGYNADTMVPAESVTTSNTDATSESTTTSTTANGRAVDNRVITDSTTNEGTSSESMSTSGQTASTTAGTSHETDSGRREHNSRAYGNIGVTTTQRMIEQERLSADFVIIDVIIKDFADRFCVGVW